MGEHVNIIDWHIHPFRPDRWFEIWLPAAERTLAFGATRWSLVRSVDDPLHFRQISVWRDPDDFERYWASDDEPLQQAGGPLLAYPRRRRAGRGTGRADLARVQPRRSLRG
jgi:hypothetical protein